MGEVNNFLYFTFTLLYTIWWINMIKGKGRVRDNEGEI